MVPRAKAVWGDDRDRVLPPRESQPDPHRRAKAPRREPQLAAVLVRPLSQQQLSRHAARCQVTTVTRGTLNLDAILFKDAGRKMNDEKWCIRPEMDAQYDPNEDDREYSPA